MKKVKILVIILIIFIILLTIAYFVAGNYFYNIAINPKTSKTFVLGEVDKESQEYIILKEKQAESKKWLEDNSKDVYITSNNNGGLKLHGYEIENTNKSDVWAIVIHGYTGQGKEMVTAAKNFYNKGYNVLIVDLRGHGQSQGNYIGMGWHDRLDIIDWSNYIIDKNKDSKIVLYGVSMGAATVMMATGENLPDNIKVAVEDCGYTSIWDEFAGQLKELFNLPTFPALNAASFITKIKAGYTLEEGSAVKQVAKSKTPTLFIHGDEDLFVPFWMLDKVYYAASCEKEKLVIKGAKHAEAQDVEPELYWNTINKFVEKYI